jgi:hypothetical protein
MESGLPTDGIKDLPIVWIPAVCNGAAGEIIRGKVPDTIRTSRLHHEGGQEKEQEKATDADPGEEKRL